MGVCCADPGLSQAAGRRGKPHGQPVSTDILMRKLELRRASMIEEWRSRAVLNDWYRPRGREEEQ